MQSATQYAANPDPSYYSLGHPDSASLGLDTDIPVPPLLVDELYTSNSDHVWDGSLVGDLEYATLEALASGRIVLPTIPGPAIIPQAYINYGVGKVPHAMYARSECIILVTSY